MYASMADGSRAQKEVSTLKLKGKLKLSFESSNIFHRKNAGIKNE